jgi:ElaB/YqjD/DUF883 family membrane-anchored ribosome-binding protein
MLFRKSTPSIHAVADTAAQSVDHAKQSTQRAADQALDKVSSTANDLRQRVSPLFARAGEEASAWAHRGMDTVRDRSLQLRDQAQRASDGTVSYIRDEPVKAVLIAAAAGAIVVALMGLLRKPA